ncbi:hypothetical protein Echvi_3997 [Echinicola vietnamensis DSM 17526]|uniref:Uncharacterized protein n=1 Tax=Echinicola vietnamensis (strain DSM 17526 / LMG 23754 / KMM 6221) TaxID=926556 RepID=L0G1W1_ECHVK|nr:hypothetical protein Echvi_3997 [Echinicola vietnamensis DSM 17526]
MGNQKKKLPVDITFIGLLKWFSYFDSWIGRYILVT